MGTAGAIPVLVSQRLARAAFDDCLRAHPHVRLAVTGACMSPCLLPGETVLIARTELRPPGLGDVVLVSRGEQIRLHRLVWRPPGRLAWRTQADRSRTPDAALARSSVLGTVIGVEGDPGRRVRRVGVALGLLARAAWSRLRAGPGPDGCR